MHQAAPAAKNTSFQLTEDADGNLQFLTDMDQLRTDLEKKQTEVVKISREARPVWSLLNLLLKC